MPDRPAEHVLRETLEAVVRETGLYLGNDCPTEAGRSFAEEILRLVGEGRRRETSKETARYALLLESMKALREWRDSVVAAGAGLPKPKLTPREKKARVKVADVLKRMDALDGEEGASDA